MSFCMLRGDTLIINITFKRDNLPIDLSSCTIFSTFKYKIDDTDEQAIFTKSINNGITITDSANGLAQIQVDPIDTQSVVGEPYLFFDVQLNENDGRVSSVRDSLKIRQDVTKSH